MSLRSRLYRFQSGLCRRVAPGLTNAQYPFFETLTAHLTAGTRWMDLGCGHQLMPHWMVGAQEKQVEAVGRVAHIVGVDLDLDSLRKNTLLRDRLQANVEHLPFADGSFDLVTANMVVEHLPNPSAALGEIHRVLAPGGKFIFHTPNRRYPTTAIAGFVPQGIKDRIVALLENRPSEDVFPVCYKLNDERSIRREAAQGGFGAVALKMVSSTPDTFMLGPAVLAELAFIRLCERESMSGWRSNIIAVLEKPGDQESGAP